MPHFGGGTTVRQFDRLAPDIPNFFMHEPLARHRALMSGLLNQRLSCLVIISFTFPARVTTAKAINTTPVHTARAWCGTETAAYGPSGSSFPRPFVVYRPSSSSQSRGTFVLL